ncbi:unnamed protein product [Heterobilharzia americana]|nr:unnamed protein product [Heterobilharzia americana]
MISDANRDHRYTIYISVCCLFILGKIINCRMTIPDELFSLISKVSSENGSIEDYERICLILSNLSTTELHSVFQRCDILKALISINLHDKQSSHIAMKLASIIFSLVSLFNFVQSHQDELLLILESTKFDLIEFILKRLRASAAEADGSTENLPDRILEAAARLVLHEKLSVSTEAQNFLITLAAKCPLGLKKVLDTPVASTLKSLCSTPEHSIRVSEFAVHLVSTRPEVFEDVKKSGLFQPIVDGLGSSDPLVCLNWLELAKTLRLLDDLQSFSSNSLADLLLPGYITFFGNLAKQNPNYWLDSNDERFRNILANAVENKNIIISMMAIETVGYIASNSTGRITLNKLFAKDGPLHSVLGKLFLLISNSPTEICTRAVECYSFLLRRPDGLNSNDLLDDAMLSLNWAIYSCQKNTDLTKMNSIEEKEALVVPLLKRLYSLGTQPFFEVRAAVFKAIDAIATQPWGVRQIIQQPGFLEYLLNRQTELGLSDNKIQLMQAKLDIINNILKTYQVWSSHDYKLYQNLINSEQIKDMKIYLKEGLWGVVHTEGAVVALESG